MGGVSSADVVSVRRCGSFGLRGLGGGVRAGCLVMSRGTDAARCSSIAASGGRTRGCVCDCCSTGDSSAGAAMCTAPAPHSDASAQRVDAGDASSAAGLEAVMELLSTGALRWGGLTPLARRGAERRAIGALASVLDCCCGKADGRSHECACEGNDCSFDGRNIAMLGWCVL